MARAIALRSDFTGTELRALAGQSKNASQARRLVSIWRILKLPTSWSRSNGDAKQDVVQAGHAAPDDHVAGRRIIFAGEVATHHCDLQQIGGERGRFEAWARSV